jgi:rubrerythrin
MLQCTPSAFITRWWKMGEEGEKEKVVTDLNKAAGKVWTCLVCVTLWEKNDGSVQAQVNVNNCLVT